MTGFVDSEEQAILNGLLQDPAWAGYTDLWVALSTTTPLDDGSNFTEPVGNGYARVQTTAADWAAATGTAPATKANGAAITFPVATGDWATGANMTHFGLFDAATVGNAVVTGTITTPKPVLADDVASFPIGDLVLRLGDPADFP